MCACMRAHTHTHTPASPCALVFLTGQPLPFVHLPLKKLPESSGQPSPYKTACVTVGVLDLQGQESLVGEQMLPQLSKWVPSALTPRDGDTIILVVFLGGSVGMICDVICGSFSFAAPLSLHYFSYIQTPQSDWICSCLPEIIPVYSYHPGIIVNSTLFVFKNVQL